MRARWGHAVVVSLFVGILAIAFCPLATAQYHSADSSADYLISLTELLRVIQFFNSGGLHCEPGTEDGYAPGPGAQSCDAHDSDYLPQDWLIGLTELLRVIQFFNSDGYDCATGTEDGFTPGQGTGDGCAGGEGEGEGESPPPLSPLALAVNPTIIPATSELPPLDGVNPRPLAAIVDERGHQAEFVENELVLVTDEQTLLDDFLARWNGVEISSYDPDDAGLTGAVQHLIRIDTTVADSSNILSDLLTLDPDARGALQVSSEAGLDLLAASAAEAVDGLTIGVNWVGRGSSISTRSTTEAASGSDGFNSSGPTYNPNAFDWHFLNTGSTQDIGVTEAWWLLEQTGRTANKVKIAILDMGFSNTAELPTPFTAISNVPFVSAMEQSNLLGCSGGGGCPWHGTNVAGTAFGRIDNSFGAAGVAGQVAQPILVFTLYDFFTSMAAVVEALAAGAKVVNMSYGAGVPAAFSFTVIPFELTTGAASLAAVLFASAGNDGANVDAEDCFIVCWEETLWTPCENIGVDCVGGLAVDSVFRAGGSNYGHEGVDIFAPYTVLVGPDPANPSNTASAVSGTSFSSPYAAGVAALIWAANPGLSAAQVRSILYETAHTSPSSVVDHYVNAQEAVRRALGSVIVIQAPLDGASVARGTTIGFQTFILEGGRGTPTVTWSSSIDGVIGTGASISRNNLSFGTHTITATAVWADTTTASDTVQLTITNNPPVMNIVTPADGAHFFQGQQINLSGTAFDPNNIPGFTLDASQVTWFVDATTLGTGFSRNIPPSTLSLGAHTIRFQGNDGLATAEDSVGIVIDADPLDLPPNVVNITNPTTGAHFAADTFDTGWFIQVNLQGNASDLEDGALTGSSLTWKTSINGGPLVTLGTGTSLNAKLYAPECFGNTHVIHLVARDSAFQESEATVQVTVELLCR